MPHTSGYYKSGDLECRDSLIEPIDAISAISRQNPVSCWLAWCCAFAGLLLLSSDAEAQTDQESTPSGSTAELEFFEKKIRPFLALECYDCHSAEKAEANLRLDYRDGLLHGGDSGPAIVPGKADESLLIQSITHQHENLQMPLDRPKLADSVIPDFVQWVNRGAFDPRDESLSPKESLERNWEQVFELRKKWWSLQPPQKPSLPVVHRQDWSSHPIDQFILATLEANQLKPATRAEAHIWLR